MSILPHPPRPSSELTLPDKTVSSLTLTEGKLVGLTDLARSGEAFLEERHERAYLTFSLRVKNLTGSYSWTRRNLGWFACFNNTGIRILILQRRPVHHGDINLYQDKTQTGDWV